MTIKIRKELYQLKPYVPGRSKQEIETLTGRDDILRVSFNESPLGPSPKAQEAIRDFLPQIHLYPDANYRELRASLAKLWQRKSENFIIGDGTDEVISMLAKTYVGPGDQVVLADPTFGAYRLGVAIQGGTIVPVALKPDFSYDLEAYLAAINERTRLVYLCSPNNPTGTYINRQQLEAFLAAVPSHVLVVLDEAYADYSEAPDFPRGCDYLDQFNVIVLRTFSKMFGLAGLRIGYGLACEEIIFDLHRVREPFNVNQVAAVAANAALNDAEYLALSRSVNSEGKQFFYQQFTEMGLAYCESQANFIWVKAGVDSKELVEAMLEEGITIRGGYAFNCPEWIRITVARAADNERIIASLKRLLPAGERTR